MQATPEKTAEHKMVHNVAITNKIEDMIEKLHEVREIISKSPNLIHNTRTDVRVFASTNAGIGKEHVRVKLEVKNTFVF